MYERQLTEHQVSQADKNLTIAVMDEPGHGGANHCYVLEGFAAELNPSKVETGELVILFQNGPLQEHGANGVTTEALLAVCADRLRGFQSGKFATKANACALTHIEEALHWLQQRTIERMRRGVEGTSTV